MGRVIARSTNPQIKNQIQKSKTNCRLTKDPRSVSWPGLSEIMQLHTCLPALLQLALGPTQDMAKGQLALPKGADAHAVVGC